MPFSEGGSPIKRKSSIKRAALVAFQIRKMPSQKQSTVNTNQGKSIPSESLAQSVT